MRKSSKIVVPVDFSDHSRAAVRRACELARASAGSVHLVHAVRPPVVMAQEFSFPADYWEVLREAASKEMEKLLESMKSEGVSITSDLVNMEAVAAICVASSDLDATLVVMGTHGYSGWKHAFLGSVTERTLRSVSAPVLAVKLAGESGEEEPISRILVATDFSAHAAAAAQLAAKWAKVLGAEIQLVHVVPEPAALLAGYSVPGGAELLQEIREVASAKLAECCEGLEASGVKIESVLAHGDAPSGIANAASEFGAQLVTMGTRGHTGLKHVLLGSVAERVLRVAPCSVLVTSEPI